RPLSRPPQGPPSARRDLMIRKNCDNCDRLLEVPDDQAGTKVRCPDCGDMNVIPQGAPAAMVGSGGGGGGGGGEGPAEARTVRPDSASAEPDRAAAAGYPPDSGPEQKVL